METFLRRRDLPAFCRSDDITDPKFKLYAAEGKGRLNSRSCGLILNTFEELDGSILAEIRNVCRNIYAVGSLLAHLRTKLLSSETTPFPSSSPSSLWPEDRSCLAWPYKQPRKSRTEILVGFPARTLLNGESLEMCAERAVAYFKENTVPQLDSEKNLTSEEVISLELSTGIPMLYIFKEKRFLRRGSPAGANRDGSLCLHQDFSSIQAKVG
nr:7-deoxyloganetic acid glucosyltransferase-like [Ipomoea batatas]